MKSFTSTRRILLAISEKTPIFTGLVVVLAALAASGCTSRKQYAINEAILIGERRQLEDEIYRTKFELRDALQENEQLRKQLEKEGLSNTSESRAGKAPQATANRPTIDEDRFPGGTKLQVGGSATAPAYQNTIDPDRYDDSPTQGGVETLPDFVPVPARSKYSLDGAKQGPAHADPKRANKTFGVKRPVALADAREPIDASAVKTASAQFVEPQANEQNVAQTAYEEPSGAPGFDVAPDDDWSPVDSF